MSNYREISPVASNNAFSTANTLEVNRSILNSLETAAPNKVLFIAYNNNDNLETNDITQLAFQTPLYMLYRQQIKYIYNDFPDSIKFNTKYTFKIFAYIQITKADNYNFQAFFAGGYVKLYLNGFMIINSSTRQESQSIYLNAGTYTLYIERIHDLSSVLTSSFNAQNGNRSLDIFLYPTSSTDKTISIDTYLHPTINYTLLTNANNSRNNGTIAFCKPETNLFNSGNICDTSLTTSNLLQNTLNDFCLPSGDILKGTNNKMNTNCRTEYEMANLNTNIRNDFITKYNTWSNKVVTDNKISENQDALEEYIIWRNPNETTFPITKNLTNYCESDVKEYVINSTNSSLCNTIYNRNYTGTNKTNIDNSIRTIRHNFCNTKNTDGTYKNITGTDCQTELKRTDLPSNTLLENDVNNYCFPNNATNIRKNTNGTYDTTCKTNIHNLTGLNTNIRNKLNTSYQTWARNTITNSNTNYTNEENALNEYIKERNPTRDQLFGINTQVPDRLVSYCDTRLGDIYQANPNTDTMCNRLLSNSRYNTDPKFITAINNKKQAYCLKTDSTGKPRYETDPLCTQDYTSLLSTEIQNRCIKNNIYQNTDSWCNNLSNNNITSSLGPYNTINERRVSLAKTQLDSGLNMTNSKLNINTNSYDFIIGSYDNYPSKKINDEVLTQKLFDFCEEKEPNYPIDDKSQCKGIYNKFKLDNQIINSRNKMRDRLCIDSNNITSDNVDDGTTNAYRCKSTVFNPDNLGKFAPTVNNYCISGDKISSNECQGYYKDIEDKILKSYNINSMIPAQFQNKYEDIELEPFQNVEPTPVEPTPIESTPIELTPVEPTPVEPTPMKDLCKVKLNDYDFEESKMETESTDFMYYLLLFVFIILITVFLTTCMKSNSLKNITDINSKQVIIPVNK